MANRTSFTCRIIRASNVFECVVISLWLLSFVCTAFLLSAGDYARDIVARRSPYFSLFAPRAQHFSKFVNEFTELGLCLF